MDNQSFSVTGLGVLTSNLAFSGRGWRTSIAVSHNSMTGRASVRIDASRDMISASAEEWETADCFLHIHDNGHQVFGPARTMNIPDVDLLSLTSPAKLASANTKILHSNRGSPRWLLIAWFLWWYIYDISLWRRLSHAIVHLVTSLANELTAHKRSGLANLAAYRALSTIFDAYGATSPFSSNSAVVKEWSSMHGVATFRKLATLMPVISMYLSTALSIAPSILYSHDRISFGFDAIRDLNSVAAAFFDAFFFWFLELGKTFSLLASSLSLPFGTVFELDSSLSCFSGVEQSGIFDFFFFGVDGSEGSS